MRPRALQLAAAATLATLLAVQRAAAQAIEPESGPVVVGERKVDWNLFDLVSYGAAIDFLGRYQSDRLEQTGQPTLTDKQTTLQGEVDLYGEAFIGHKNLIDLVGRFAFRFENQWLDSQTFQTNQTTQQLEFLYDVNARMFNASWVPTDIYARHDQQNVNRDFGTPLELTTTEFGIIANIQSDVFPSIVQYSHTDTDQSDLLAQYDYHLRKDTISLVTTLTFSELHQLDVRYIVDSISETQQGVYSTDYIRNDLSIADTLTFGADKFAQLRSYFKYYEQNGLFAQSTIRWEEQLWLTHSNDLESRYTFAANRQTANGNTQDSIRGGASVRHKLFDSLVTNAFAGVEWFTADDFDSNQIFGGFLLEYTKHVQPGVLDVTTGANYNYQQNSAQGGTISIIDDPYVWLGQPTIVVSRPNVVPGSLTITGPGGIPVYTNGFDYTVVYYPDRFEVSPIPGRSIPIGSTLLMDYQIGPEPASNIGTLSASFGVRYTVTEGWGAGLAGYASYRLVTHSVDSANPSAIIVDDINEALFGVEFRRWGLHLTAEQLFHQSNVNPYDATRLLGTYDLRLGINSILSVDAAEEFTTYRNPTNDVNFFRAGVRWIQQLGDNWELDSRLIYRNEQNQLQGNSDGVDARLSLRWQLRQTSAYISTGYTIFGTSSTNTTSQLLEIGFRREF